VIFFALGGMDAIFISGVRAPQEFCCFLSKKKNYDVKRIKTLFFFQKISTRKDNYKHRLTTISEKI